MDPNACIDIVNSSSDSNQDRLDSLRDLAEWLGRGGFPPSDSPGVSDASIELFRELGARDLALAVNVAIAYGDLSGLEGAL